MTSDAGTLRRCRNKLAAGFLRAKVMANSICRRLADRSKRAIGAQMINNRSLSMKDDTQIDNILGDVASILELHSLTLQQHRQAIERLFAEIAEVKKQLSDKSKSPDARNSTDTEFIESMTARLKAIPKTIDKGKLQKSSLSLQKGDIDILQTICRHHVDNMHTYYKAKKFRITKESENEKGIEELGKAKV